MTTSKILNITIIFLCLLPFFADAQLSTMGSNGLLSIPTANMMGDGQISFGTNFLNKKYLDYTHKEKDAFNVCVTLNYLPFLELSFKITRRMETYYPHRHHTADRTPSIRLRLFQEREYLPSLLVGVHDPGSAMGTAITVHFHTLYFVCSKNLELPYVLSNIGIHGGYAADWFNADDYQMKGVFGGISLQLEKYLTLILEYDSEYINPGIRLSFFNHIHLLGGFQNFDAPTGGLSFQFQL